MLNSTSEVRLQKWPGGLYTVTGGTRTSVKLDRPWQVDMEVNPETCPFCTKPQEIIEDHGDWIVLPNAFTPYPTHRLVIPRVCLPKSGLRMLGGSEGITTALGIGEATISKIGKPQMFHSVHCGYLAGQRLPHLHYHVLDNEFSGFKSHDASDEVLRLADEIETRVFARAGITVVAGGHRAGQCYIIPTGDFIYSTDVGGALFRLIQMFAERFMSKQRLPPDFAFSGRFRDGRFAYGKFTPVLNNWGATEHNALEGEQPFTLPWPHEETVRHLLARKE